MTLPALHILRSLDPAQGGPAELVRQLCIAHAAMGAPIEVAALDSPDAEWLADWPGALHAFPGRGVYGWSPEFVRWLHSKRSAYSAIFIHGLWQWQSGGTWQALKGSDTRYFLFPHGMLDPWFREAWPIRHARKTVYWRLIEHRVARDAAAVLFTCEEERLRGRGTFRPWLPRKEIVIPLGTVPPPRPSKELRADFFARFPDLRGQRLLLFLGRIHEKKGCDLLIEAFRRVAPPMRLVFAGPFANERLERRLREMADGLPVTFSGPLYGGEKWSAFAAAEAFALTSHQENFGVAVAEALASSVPVLITDKVNIWREVVEDGAGFAEPDTLEGAVRLLTRWIAADREAMRAAAARCFAARFDIRQTAQNLWALATPQGE